MNMKKTIAAIAACAMAVSAMATTVSAADDNSTAEYNATYSLVKQEKIRTADYTFSYVNPAIAATKIQAFIPAAAANGWINSGTVVTATIGSRQFKFCADKSSEYYDGSARLFEVKDLPTLDALGSTDAVKADYYVFEIDLSVSSGAALGELIKNANGSENTTLAITMSTNTAYEQKEMGALVDTDYTSAVPGTITVANASALDVKVEYKEPVDVLEMVDTPTYAAGLVTGDIVCVATDGTDNVALNARVKVNDDVKKTPFYTSTNTTTGASDIISYLENSANDLKGIGKGSYNNVKAVLNDMIANYDDVEFTFNTAVEKVTAAFGGEYQGWGSVDYTKFPQQVYNLFGDENSGYRYSNDYEFTNLFNAALVANNGYTMNQSSIAPFKYDGTSLTFSWNDLTGGNSYVSYAGALTTLQLATSSNWAWDNMVVTGYSMAAEDASTEAGVEDEGEDLDDEDLDDADETDDIEDETDDIDVDETDDVDVDDAEEVEAPAVSNPSTGNAPIALAVIPVALAAAAVVAKKRG